VARAAGLRGGCLIFHPWREHKDETGRGLGDWFWSPHFHIVGYGWISQTAYARTGWVVKNHGLRKSVYETLSYQLSHAGVHMPQKGILPVAKGSKPHKFCTLVWFGCCSYNKLKVAKRVERATCPECGYELVRLVWVGDGDPPAPVEGESWDLESNWRVVTRFDV
jgi:hypothetical protein